MSHTVSQLHNFTAASWLRSLARCILSDLTLEVHDPLQQVLSRKKCKKRQETCPYLSNSQTLRLDSAVRNPLVFYCLSFPATDITRVHPTQDISCKAGRLQTALKNSTNRCNVQSPKATHSETKVDIKTAQRYTKSTICYIQYSLHLDQPTAIHKAKTC